MSLLEVVDLLEVAVHVGTGGVSVVAGVGLLDVGEFVGEVDGAGFVVDAGEGVEKVC